MKTFLTAAVVATAAILGSHSGAQAQQNAPYCSRTDEGNMNCSYQTMEQCQASLKGASTTGTCVRNPTMDK